MSDKKWWLISDEVVQRIRSALSAAITHIDDDCATSGCLCDLSGPLHSAYYSDALHELDSGLNTTTAIPDDWKEEK